MQATVTAQCRQWVANVALQRAITTVSLFSLARFAQVHSGARTWGTGDADGGRRQVSPYVTWSGSSCFCVFSPCLLSCLMSHVLLFRQLSCIILYLTLSLVAIFLPFVSVSSVSFCFLIHVFFLIVSSFSHCLLSLNVFFFSMSSFSQCLLSLNVFLLSVSCLPSLNLFFLSMSSFFLFCFYPYLNLLFLSFQCILSHVVSFSSCFYSALNMPSLSSCLGQHGLDQKVLAHEHTKGGRNVSTIMSGLVIYTEAVKFKVRAFQSPA